MSWRGRVGLLSRLAAVAVLLAGMLGAQSITVYSEFRRVDPFGRIVPQDRGGEPREILSPLAARNAHLTFHVVVEAPPGKYFYLVVGTNPEKVFQISVYKEMWRREGKAWIPDRLLPVTLPYLGQLPDRYHGLPNQKVECFLLDVFVPAGVNPGRVKLEPQVNVGDSWAIYPMEVRISVVAAPALRIQPGRLPGVKLPADAAVLGPLREYLCGTPEKRGDSRESIRQIIRRNVLEDLAIARQLEKQLGKEAVAKGILRGLGWDRASFCAAKEVTGPLGPEWYLRGRDFLRQGLTSPP